MENLHQKFIKLGHDRRKLTNELLALLPEIYEKGIYKKYAATIVEYAGKFGGLSKGVVLKRLKLKKYLKDKPLLREAIKTEGVHKISLIAKLATTETEMAWVDKVKNMSKTAIQELSKEVRGKNLKNDQLRICDFGDENFEEDGQSNFCRAATAKITVELDNELTFMFLKLKKKLVKEHGKELSNREVLKKIFERELAEKKEKIPEDFSKKILKSCEGASQKCVQKSIRKPISRYVQAKLRTEKISQTHGKCNYPNCNKPFEILHHSERFAAGGSHHSIIPLCKTHHEFAHNGLIINETKSTGQWELGVEREDVRTLGEIDLMYRKMRRRNF